MEKLIQEIMKDLKCNREDAEEVAKMELKAKGLKRYEQSDKPRKKTERKVELDKTKVEILEYLVARMESRHCFLEEEEWDFEHLKIKNPQKEITFSIGEDEYSLTLTKHRKKK